MESFIKREKTGNRIVRVAAVIAAAVAVMALMISPVAFAEKKEGGKGHGPRKWGRAGMFDPVKMQKKLDLSETQVNQLKRVFAASKKKMKGLRAKYEGESRQELRENKEFRSEMKKIRKWTDGKVASILNKQQMAKLEKIKKMRRKRMKEKREKRATQEKVDVQN